MNEINLQMNGLSSHFLNEALEQETLHLRFYLIQILKNDLLTKKAVKGFMTLQRITNSS